ncbi:EamA family transporter [Nocardia blacklockiae]|uniref:EamA family transporter n=1 Tax=Nocardia blacklockiae TaxID=480036 RepID=UPI00189635CE|nr:DMT family transporter [Nocardia blacklockiae]MBF6175588.1 DMT family transporter [Nocardia blacklockiae]
MRAPLVPLVLMVAVTCLWGASSALLAVLAVPTTAGLVALGGAVTLLLLAWLCGERPWAALAAQPSLYARLGGLETANLALYVAALRIGPLPVVAALHLTAPVLIITAALVRGRRPPTMAVVLELVLVAAAIWLVTGSRPAAATAGAAVAGCLLALGSAACVAALVSLIAREAGPDNTITSAGLQLLVAGAASSPLLIIDPPGPRTTAALAAVGALLLGPGFALYWQALRWLDAATAGIVGLNEAVVAALVGALCTETRLTAATAGAGVLILLAVGLEQRSVTRRRVPP